MVRLEIHDDLAGLVRPPPRDTGSSRTLEQLKFGAPKVTNAGATVCDRESRRRSVFGPRQFRTVGNFRFAKQDKAVWFGVGATPLDAGLPWCRQTFRCNTVRPEQKLSWNQ